MHIVDLAAAPIMSTATDLIAEITTLQSFIAGQRDASRAVQPLASGQLASMKSKIRSIRILTTVEALSLTNAINGVDFWTDAEMLQLCDVVTAKLMAGATGKRGGATRSARHYRNVVSTTICR